jgi:hypothetical protein
MFRIQRSDLKFSILTSLKDQLGYAVRDFLYYNKRCGRDVATLEPIDYSKHADIMIQENDMEKEIKLVLTHQQETIQPVSITPMKRRRQQTEDDDDDDDHPFMDDELNAYKDWLQNLPVEKLKGLSSIFLCLYCYCS